MHALDTLACVCHPPHRSSHSAWAWWSWPDPKAGEECSSVTHMPHPRRVQEARSKLLPLPRLTVPTLTVPRLHQEGKAGAAQISEPANPVLPSSPLEFKTLVQSP